MFELETIEILLMAWEKIFQKIELGVTDLARCSMSNLKTIKYDVDGVEKIKAKFL